VVTGSVDDENDGSAGLVSVLYIYLLLPYADALWR